MEGYVYVFTTAATRLLRIGKTTRDPVIRAQELSAGTGVPFPFQVAYSVYVNDCATLEQCVHTKLSNRRANYKREFFEVTLEEAIEAIDYFLIKESAGHGSASQAPCDPLDDVRSAGTSLQLNSNRVPAAYTKVFSTEPVFDTLAYAREQMIANARQRITSFKDVFQKAADAYRLIRPLECQPMQSGKQYPPVSITLSRETTIYISYLFWDDYLKKPGYSLGTCTPGAIEKDRYGISGEDNAKRIIALAAPVFLVKDLGKRSDYVGGTYDPDEVYSALDYRTSIPKRSSYSDSDFIEIKPDIINYLEGYADLDYLAAKYLNLPYPFSQSPSTTTKTRSIRGLLSRLLLPLK